MEARAPREAVDVPAAWEEGIQITELWQAEALAQVREWMRVARARLKSLAEGIRYSDLPPIPQPLIIAEEKVLMSERPLQASRR